MLEEHRLDRIEAKLDKLIEAVSMTRKWMSYLGVLRPYNG